MSESGDRTLGGELVEGERQKGNSEVLGKEGEKISSSGEKSAAIDFKSGDIRRRDTSRLFVKISDAESNKRKKDRAELTHQKKQERRRRDFRRLIKSTKRKEESAERRKRFVGFWGKHKRDFGSIFAVVLAVLVLAMAGYISWLVLRPTPTREEVRAEEYRDDVDMAVKIFEDEVLPIANSDMPDSYTVAVNKGEELLRTFRGDGEYIYFSSAYATFLYDNWGAKDGVFEKSISVLDRASQRVSLAHQRYNLNQAYLYIYIQANDTENIEKYSKLVEEYQSELEGESYE